VDSKQQLRQIRYKDILDIGLGKEKHSIFIIFSTGPQGKSPDKLELFSPSAFQIYSQMKYSHPTNLMTYKEVHPRTRAQTR